MGVEGDTAQVTPPSVLYYLSTPDVHVPKAASPESLLKMQTQKKKCRLTASNLDPNSNSELEPGF